MACQDYAICLVAPEIESESEEGEVEGKLNVMMPVMCWTHFLRHKTQNHNVAFFLQQT